jgi:hypothetical protein
VIPPPPPPDDTRSRLAELLDRADAALGERRVEIRRPIRLAERAIRLRAIVLTVSAVTVAVALTAGAAVARDRLVDDDDGTVTPSAPTSTPTASATSGPSTTGPTTTQAPPPPVVTIIRRPDDPTNQTTATFAFTVDPPGSPTTCVLDAGTATPCESGTPFEVGEGPHTFEVRALDEQGQAGPAATYTWTVDRTAPTVELTSALLVYGGTADQPVCAVDGKPWDCSAPVTEFVGRHTLAVAFGDTTLTWTLDPMPPSVVFANEGDPTASVTSEIRLAFALSEGTPICTVDSAERPCADGVLIDQLTSDEGQLAQHALQVSATDPAGNAASPAPLAWSFARTVSSVD